MRERDHTHTDPESLTDDNIADILRFANEHASDPKASLQKTIDIRLLAAEVERLRAELAAPIGCADHGCIVTTRAGHGTNGGCRCDERTLRRAVRKMRRELAAVDDALDGLSVPPDASDRARNVAGWRAAFYREEGRAAGLSYERLIARDEIRRLGGDPDVLPRAVGPCALPPGAYGPAGDRLAAEQAAECAAWQAAKDANRAALPTEDGGLTATPPPATKKKRSQWIRVRSGETPPGGAKGGEGWYWESPVGLYHVWVNERPRHEPPYYAAARVGVDGYNERRPYERIMPGSPEPQTWLVDKGTLAEAKEICSQDADERDDGLTAADRKAGWRWEDGEHGPLLCRVGSSLVYAAVTHAGWSAPSHGAPREEKHGPETGAAGKRAAVLHLRSKGALPPRTT